MLLLRKILFYVFTLSYIVLCPLMILYAFGYIFKPGIETEIVKTGVISLNTVPQGASVYVQDELYPDTTPAVLAEMLPGEYNIRVLLEGYRLWTHIVPVEAARATVFEKILLIPDKWPVSELSSGPFQDIIPVKGENIFIIKKGPLLEEHFIFFADTGEAISFAGDDSPFKGSKVGSLTTVKGSSMFLAHVNSGGERRVLKGQVKNNNVELIDITGLFSDDADLIRWCPEDENSIFYCHGDSLNKVSLDSGAVYPDYLTGVKGYGLYEKSIYAVMRDDTVISMSYDKGGRTDLLDDPALGASIFKEKGPYRIYPLEENSILFISKKGGLLSNRLPYHFVRSGVKGISYHRASSRVLVWCSDSVGVLDFSTEETQNVVFEKGPDFSWIYTGGKAISSAFWVYDGSHVILEDSGEVFLIEPEPAGAPHVNKVTDVSRGTGIAYEDKTGELYYIEKPGGGLCSVTVIADRGGTLPDAKENAAAVSGQEQ